MLVACVSGIERPPLSGPQEFFETSLEFQKLEKVEVGGIRGKALSAEVVVVFNQFNDYYGHFAGVVSPARRRERAGRSADVPPLMMSYLAKL